MLSTGRFYCLFLIQAAHYGGVLLVINLVIQMAGSFGVPLGPLLVLLISLGSTTGRIGIGHIASALGDTLTTPLLLGGLNLGTFVVNVLLALYIRSTVLFCLLVFCSGWLYGAMAVVAASGVVQMFGVTHVAKNDGMFDLASAMGSLVIAYGLIAIFPPQRNTDDDDAGGCRGAQCYQKALVVSACLCCLAALSALCLHWHLKRLPNLGVSAR